MILPTRLIIAAAIGAIGCFIVSCEKPGERVPAKTGQNNFSKEAALGDVSASDATLAFSGDPEKAQQIADNFADSNRFDPAVFWYQIAAENGSPQAKHSLAILLRKKNCARAIFWMKSYIQEGVSVIGQEPYDQAQKSLKTYRDECRN